jgi:hypothetical protein
LLKAHWSKLLQAITRFMPPKLKVSTSIQQTANGQGNQVIGGIWGGTAINRLETDLYVAGNIQIFLRTPVPPPGTPFQVAPLSSNYVLRSKEHQAVKHKLLSTASEAYETLVSQSC